MRRYPLSKETTASGSRLAMDGKYERWTVMTTPTLAQGQKLLLFLSHVNATREQVQSLLANGDLLKELLNAPDLSKVSREKFQALMAPPPQVIDWTPVHQYADKLREWSEQKQLEFSLLDEHIANLVVPDHAGPYQPTSIVLEYGIGFAFNLRVVREVLAYELHKLGVPFTDTIGQQAGRFLDSKPEQRRSPQLNAALLDIGRFWDFQNGVSVREVRERLAGQPLPGLEVYWLMALNAQVFAAIDRTTVPALLVPGLVVGSGEVPVFDRGLGEVCVDSCKDGVRWGVGSVVAFREC